MSEFITISGESAGEIEEKKSRFIAALVPCTSEDEAVTFIESVRKKNRDARHNCYAYVIGEKGETVKCSDDGEPQKTAGQPILSVIQGAGLTNVCLVETRYFGGTLLGTGGLVRAYSDSAKAAVDNAKKVKKIPGILLSISTEYSDMGTIQYILNSENITIRDTEYTDGVVFTTEVESSKYEQLSKKLIDATGARVKLGKMKDMLISAEI
ncbi:MAG: YigZ family protein [Lachnospiraceae bacterium]|nr:YigZ family protein [Lachnospiraceae bacterium]